MTGLVISVVVAATCANVLSRNIAPHQIVHDGVVYLDGDTITDVPKTTAQEWIAHGWAEDATGKYNTPAKKPRQAKNSHRASAEME
jgi:hypothetical protein